MAETKYMNASQAWNEFSIPRSALRELAEEGVIEMIEKSLYGDKVMKLYSRQDIERYLNEQ